MSETLSRIFLVSKDEFSEIKHQGTISAFDVGDVYLNESNQLVFEGTESQKKSLTEWLIATLDNIYYQYNYELKHIGSVGSMSGFDIVNDTANGPNEEDYEVTEIISHPISVSEDYSNVTFSDDIPEDVKNTVRAICQLIWWGKENKGR